MWVTFSKSVHFAPYNGTPTVSRVSVTVTTHFLAHMPFLCAKNWVSGRLLRLDSLSRMGHSGRRVCLRHIFQLGVP